MSRDTPLTVEYKIDETYEDNEFCMWRITKAAGGWGAVSIVIESDMFESCCDGVEGYYINTTLSVNPIDVGFEKCDL